MYEAMASGMEIGAEATSAFTSVSPLVSWLANTKPSDIIAATQYLESEDAKVPDPVVSEENAAWAVLKEDDDYDPRKPEFVQPATASEVMLEELRLLQQQIGQLRVAIKQREQEDNREDVLGHYRHVLEDLSKEEVMLKRMCGSAGGDAPAPQAASEPPAAVPPEGTAANGAMTEAAAPEPPSETRPQLLRLLPAMAVSARVECQAMNPQEPMTCEPQTPLTPQALVSTPLASRGKRRASWSAMKGERTPGVRRRRLAAAAPLKRAGEDRFHIGSSISSSESEPKLSRPAVVAPAGSRAADPVAKLRRGSTCKSPAWKCVRCQRKGRVISLRLKPRRRALSILHREQDR